jgi:hypothetical protein
MPKKTRFEKTVRNGRNPFPGTRLIQAALEYRVDSTSYEQSFGPGPIPLEYSGYEIAVNVPLRVRSIGRVASWSGSLGSGAYFGVVYPE